MAKSAIRRTKEKGFAILITTASIFLILPVVGLAIDAGFLYVVRAKLSAATDAAALAAARSLAKGMTLAEQEGTAVARAQAFFDANFPDGLLMTRNRSANITVWESGYRTRTVNVEGSVDAGLFFMRSLGDNATTVRATGRASRRDVNLILVLDKSGSMSSTGSCEPMKAAAKGFVNQFANGRDRLGMVTFSTGAKIDYAPSMNFQPNLNNKIDTINCSGWTNSATALWKAYQQLQTLNEPGVLNLILFFTDGQPTALTANFPVKMLKDQRYEVNNGWNSYEWMNPSPCKDANGERYYRNASGSIYYNYPPWNPNWNPGSITGVMAGSQTSGSHGLTEGLRDITTGNLLRVNRSCKYETNSDNYLRRDFAYIPEQDAYGNSTSGYLPSIRFTWGVYDGHIRIDEPTALRAAAKNVAYNAAYNILDDQTLGPVIYAIGLGDPTNPSYAPDQDFMLRVSNDPTSPVYNENHQPGLYVFAPDNTQLQQAFYRVASEILRIAR